MNRWGFRSNGMLWCVVLGLGLSGCAGTQEAAEQPAPIEAAAVEADPTMTVVSMAYPTGNPATSAINVEKAIPREVAINTNFTYQITATNLTDGPLHNVIVSEGMSSNIDVIGSEPEGESREERTLSWELGTLGAHESKTVQITAVATGRSRISSCASVTYNSMLCADAVVVNPELTITQTGPTDSLLCDPIIYTISVANAGTGTVQGVQITDELPEGLIAVDGRTVITIDVGSLASGESKAYEMKVQASARGEYTNNATASADGGLSASTEPVVTSVHEPVLEITNQGPTQRYLGRQTIHEIVVTNTGDGDARDTVVSVEISPNATLIDASGDAVAADGKVTWSVGTIAPEQSKTVSVTLGTEDEGLVTTAATAQADCAAPATASAQTTYEGIPAILLEVIDLEDPIAVGQTTTYQITATNQGSAAATAVTVLCSLEGNVQYVSSAGATEGQVEDGSVSFVPLSILNPGERATWSIVVEAIEVGDVRFHVRMTSDQLTRPVQETEATNIYE